MITKIPIRNLYYLLSYAWGQLVEDEPAEVSGLSGADSAELLARVLVAGMRQAMRHGLNRDYLPHCEAMAGVRGRLRIADSAKRSLLQRGRAVCDYDELDHNNLTNRIIKTTLGNLRDAESMRQTGRDFRNEIASVLARWRDIGRVELRPALFRRIRLHRGNAHYGMLLAVCELAFDCLMPEQGDGVQRFKDFVQDRKIMARIYENFVRNFYDSHARRIGYSKIHAPKIDWFGTHENEASAAALPEMRTDIMLESPFRKIIVDCKFYENAYSDHFDEKKLHAGNLYQIFAYVKNQGAVPGWDACEGLLLYPTVSEEFHHVYNMSGNRIVAATVNLDRDWKDIHSRLLELISHH